MVTFSTLGDMLLQRYVVDMIQDMQKLSAPVWSRLKTNKNFISGGPTGQGAYFAIRIDGNEAGLGWRAADNNTLPSAGNERVVQARVRPKKFYATVTFSGLAEAVSKRGGEDAFASGITDALNMAVKRSGARFEETFLRGDGTGRITNVNGDQSSVTTLDVDDARTFRSGQSIVFLNNTSGLRQAGPVQVTSRDVPNSQITVSAAVSVSDNDGIYINGEQDEASAPSEITMLGLPAIVNNTGTIYNKSRTTYPILQSKVIAAGSTSLDESMLRRLRKQLMVETAAESTDGYVLISNHDQFDRYTEIALPFRRFPDMKLELGANQAMTTFEGHPWLVTWAALPDQVYFLNLDMIEQGVVRPLSIDERVSMCWVPGQDSFSTLMKFYGEVVCRALNQSSKITGLTLPTY